MPLDETDLSMNWTNVTLTPEGGSAIPLKDVTDVKVMRGSKQVKFYGGNRRFPRLIKNVEKSRGISISTGDIRAIALLVEDVTYTVNATLCDARNGTGVGAINVTLVNALLQGNPFSGTNNQFAMIEISFDAFANNNDVDPLTMVEVTA